MSILENLEKLKTLVKTELDAKNNEIAELRKDLDSNKAKLKKVNEFDKKNKELEQEIKKLQQEKNELLEYKDKIEKLKEENNSLHKKLEGYRYSIKIISNWLPSQKESIDVLISLSESTEHTASFEELHRGTKIPAVVLKNRVIPLLAEKNLVELMGNSVKMLEIEE